jgi:hypothetical protein
LAILKNTLFEIKLPFQINKMQKQDMVNSTKTSAFLALALMNSIPKGKLILRNQNRRKRAANFLEMKI